MTLLDAEAKYCSHQATAVSRFRARGSLHASSGVANHLPTTTALHRAPGAASSLQLALKRQDLARLALASTAAIRVRFPYLRGRRIAQLFGSRRGGHSSAHAR